MTAPDAAAFGRERESGPPAEEKTPIRATLIYIPIDPTSGVSVPLSLEAALVVVAVAVGKRPRGRLTERARRAVVLGLLSVVGVRLLAGGLGVF